MFIKRKTVLDIIFRYSQVASEPPMDKEDEAVLKILHEITNEIKSIPAEETSYESQDWICRSCEHGTSDGGYCLDCYYGNKYFKNEETIKDEM